MRFPPKAAWLLSVGVVAGLVWWMTDLNGQEVPDLREVEADLKVPAMVEGVPRAGLRVRQTLPGYESTAVHHALYLPTDWERDETYPLLVEFAGNKTHGDPHGDVSTGKVDGSKLGYGMSEGRGFLWICLPYLSGDGKRNVERWWGSGPEFDPEPTVQYCREAVAWVCDEYGGDRGRVILCGFSRGAIACNYIGLYDDEIASLWRAFVAYSHYDGVVENWGYPNADRKSARERLARLRGRPQFICHEHSTRERTNLAATRTYLESTGVEGEWTFVETGFRNHADAWVLRPSAAREELRSWLAGVVRN